jgi:hypothetical protein
MQHGVLFKVENMQEIIFAQNESCVDLVLLNKAIQSESNLKDLQIFSADSSLNNSQIYFNVRENKIVE